jgi:hypothetical protein
MYVSENIIFYAELCAVIYEVLAHTLIPSENFLNFRFTHSFASILCSLKLSPYHLKPLPEFLTVSN